MVVTTTNNEIVQQLQLFPLIVKIQRVQLLLVGVELTDLRELWGGGSSNILIYLIRSLHHRFPIVAQWLMNPTRIHEDVGSIPGLARWVKYPVLP